MKREKGVVRQILAPVTYLVEAKGETKKRPIDQLLPDNYSVQLQDVALEVSKTGYRFGWP